MNQPAHGERSLGQEKKRVLTRVAAELTRLHVEDYQVDPALPDILVQPDLLVVPRLGSLATVTVARIPEPSKEWPFTLEIIEGLFELKLASGPDTVASILLLDSGNADFREQDAFQLLGRLFDLTYVLPVRAPINQIRDFVAQLVSSSAREGFRYLWDIERSVRQRNLSFIESRPYVRRLLDEFGQSTRQEYSSPSSVSIEELRNRVEQRLYQILDLSYTIREQPRILNIKRHFLDVGEHYYFTFDFLLQNHLSSIVQVIRGSPKTYGGQQRLRELAIQATFVRYRSLGERLRLKPRWQSLNLVIDGDLLGPEHSPKRYLRLLIAAGWNPIQLSELSMETLDLEGRWYG
jgi:hypothetical protein